MSAKFNARPSWEALASCRFFLAWIVLCGHMLWFSAAPAPWAMAFDAFGGKAAVVGFLLISGYSIAASLEKNESGFYRRRFLRIYPLYFFAIVFAIGLEIAVKGQVVLPHRVIQSEGWQSWVGNLFLLQTFFVKPVQFDAPVWSLSIEVFYYLCAPYFVRAARYALLVCVFVSALAFVAPKHSDWGMAYLVFSKFNALKYLWCWLLGFLLWREPGPVVYASLALGILPIIFGSDTPEPLALATYCSTVVLMLVSHKIKFSQRLRAAGDYLGDVSYPLYLFHLPSMIFAYDLLVWRSPLALAAFALGVSLFAYHAIDRFFKQKYIKPLLLVVSNA